MLAFEKESKLLYLQGFIAGGDSLMDFVGPVFLGGGEHGLTRPGQHPQLAVSHQVRIQRLFDHLTRA